MLEAIDRFEARPRWAVIKDARHRQQRRRRRALAMFSVGLLAVAAAAVIDHDTRTVHSATASNITVGSVKRLRLGGIVQDTTTLQRNLWVLNCLEHCSGPASPAVRAQLIELSSAGRSIKRFPVTDAGAITAGDGAVWLAHFSSGKVSRIDPQTGKTTATTRLQLPEPITSNGDRRFIPSAMSFSGDRVWVSTARGWTAEINPRSARLIRMAYSSSEATSATTADGKTWIADELSGVGTFSANSTHATPHAVAWAGQPLSIDTVAHQDGLIWTLGSRELLTLRKNLSVTIVSTMDPVTGIVEHQWRVGNAATMVFANGSAYVANSNTGQLIRLTPPDHDQILLGPKVSSLQAATPDALWATTRSGRLVRIELTRPRAGDPA